MRRRLAAFTRGPRGRRRLRRAVQVPARAERVRAAPPRLPDRARRARRCEIDVVIPFSKPVPPSPDTSEALLAAFDERGIRFVAERRVAALDAGAVPSSTTAAGSTTTSSSACRSTARPTSCSRARSPRTATSRSTRGTLATRFPGVYAVGDVATIGVPKAGVFSERAARVVAATDRRGAPRRPGARAVRRARLLLHRVRRRPGRPRRRRLLLRARSRPGRSRSPPPSSSPRRSTSARAARPAGSASGALQASSRASPVPVRAPGISIRRCRSNNVL